METVHKTQFDLFTSFRCTSVIIKKAFRPALCNYQSLSRFFGRIYIDLQTSSLSRSTLLSLSRQHALDCTLENRWGGGGWGGRGRKSARADSRCSLRANSVRTHT